MDTIKLLQAYFNKEKYEFTGDKKEELKIQNDQSLAPFLYYVYGAPFKGVYLGAALIQEKFFHLQDEITTLFNEYHIKHVFLKGSVISKLYDDPVLRTRGDIDILVSKKDLKLVRNIFKKNGFKFDHKTVVHDSYLKNGISIEIHKGLFSEAYSYQNFFSNAIDNTYLIENYKYELNENFHFLFCLCHLDKHILWGGESLRYVLDFYYMSKKWNLDFNYIEETAKALEVNELYHEVMSIAYLITTEKLPGYTGVSPDNLIHKMNKYGVHSKKIANLTDLFLDSGKSKFRYLLDKLFLPDMASRISAFPILSKYKILYPLLVLIRGFKLVLFRFKYFIQILKVKKK